MTEWTTKLRYLPYNQWPQSQLDDIKYKISKSHWRLGYHIQPTTGLLNDPNGFSYYNNQWHLFYQSFPYGPVHGLKSWDHLTSDDLVHWKDNGIAIYADTKNDSQGAYSGSAIVSDDQLFIVYTGNVRDESWVRHPKQIGAVMNENNEIKKISEPLINEPRAGYTDHFRDPQIIEHDNKFYIILGAQKTDKTGHVLVYEADKVTGPWSFKTELHFTNEEMGYMVECPNLVFINNQPVLIFCPQGISKSILDYHNIYPNAYVIGESFDWDTFTFINPSKLHNLDDGFDVYATQAFNSPDGRALCVSWIGLPEIEYPTDVEGWAHCYSLVKELKINNGKLYQLPVVENKKLELNKFTTDKISAQSKLKINVPANNDATVSIISDRNDQFKITFDSKNGKIVVDRSKFGQNFAQAYGESRLTEVDTNKDITAVLYFDNTVFELFINDGEKVITGRLFPTGTEFFVKSDNADVESIQLDKIN
ncbi:sucrose-6-phosphate hydrolase [Companilactobacillus allii]|uniref:Sucrose-6-phosphate hydrolase n=1 Tax=Companilactobacillus allii TaxID=1847728 RepID=A0A1P8Q6F8_9LACO|nr:sucrose-6-phosphate hydrolase [Companilactobacillus allii]